MVLIYELLIKMYIKGGRNAAFYNFSLYLFHAIMYNNYLAADMEI